jgi:hypothetical protein
MEFFADILFPGLWAGFIGWQLYHFWMEPGLLLLLPTEIFFLAIFLYGFEILRASLLRLLSYLANLVSAPLVIVFFILSFLIQLIFIILVCLRFIIYPFLYFCLCPSFATFVSISLLDGPFPPYILCFRCSLPCSQNSTLYAGLGSDKVQGPSVLKDANERGRASCAAHVERWSIHLLF